MLQPIFCLAFLIDACIGWGLTETNFTSDALKEVEVGLLLLLFLS